MLCVFGDHTFVAVSWLCKKQTVASHSSTEAEVMSLDTGLRMEGLLALTLWDIVIDVLEPNVSRARSDHSRRFKFQASQTAQETVDHVPANAQKSSNRLHVFSVYFCGL